MSIPTLKHNKLSKGKLDYSTIASKLDNYFHYIKV